MVCEEDGEEQRGVPEGWISDNAQPSMLRSSLTPLRWPSQSRCSCCMRRHNKKRPCPSEPL